MAWPGGADAGRAETSAGVHSHRKAKMCWAVEVAELPAVPGGGDSVRAGCAISGFAAGKGDPRR